jgi:hypothetical protein
MKSINIGEVRIKRRDSETISIYFECGIAPSTINNNPKKKRYHPSLYARFDKILTQHKL